MNNKKFAIVISIAVVLLLTAGYLMIESIKIDNEILRSSYENIVKELDITSDNLKQSTDQFETKNCIKDFYLMSFNASKNINEITNKCFVNKDYAMPYFSSYVESCMFAIDDGLSNKEIREYKKFIIKIDSLFDKKKKNLFNNKEYDENDNYDAKVRENGDIYGFSDSSWIISNKDMKALCKEVENSCEKFMSDKVKSE